MFKEHKKFVLISASCNSKEFFLRWRFCSSTSARRRRRVFHSSLALSMNNLSLRALIFLENSKRPFFRVAMGFCAILGEFFVYKKVIYVLWF